MAGRPQLPNIQPQIILLREGTDTSQGTPQLLSNINACLAVAQTVASTLGPRGMDKLIVSVSVQQKIKPPISMNDLFISFASIF